MPQGVVIAIKPRNLVDDPEQYLHSGVENDVSKAYSLTRPKGVEPEKTEIDVYYIRINKNDDLNRKKGERIVWFEDLEDKYKVNDRVDFKVRNGKKRKITEVVDVEKVKRYPIKVNETSLLLKVVMLASLFILGSGLLNKKNH